LQIKQFVDIDAARTNSGDGRMINDSRGSGFTNNCKFIVDRSTGKAIIRASKNINSGDELYISYGPGYWSVQNQALGKKNVSKNCKKNFIDLTSIDVINKLNAERLYQEYIILCKLAKLKSITN